MRIILIFYFFLFLAGCSIQSYQYDMAKDLLVRKGSSDEKPSPNWHLKWMGVEKRVFAINNNNNVFFTDGESIVHYNGWDIVSIKGLNYDDVELRINDDDNTISYMVGRKIISNVLCNDWERIASDDKYGYERRCSNSLHSFKDMVILNNKNELTSLEFTLIPGKPAIKITLEL